MGGKKHNNNKGKAPNSKKAEREMRKFHRRKRDRIKYGGDKWCADFKKLSEQLHGLGLGIKDVAGDGNCLFRAIGDQLENNPNRHLDYRTAILNFMVQNREMFEPFLDAEEDGTFDEYIRGMRENGAWGGNLEIQAASLLLKINIIIYQLDQPRWEMVNFTDPKTRTIQLSYLDGDHYASVRPLDTNTVAAQVTAIPSHLPTTTATTTQNAAAKFADDLPPNDFEKIIMNSSGVTDLHTVRQALEEHEYDADATIAYLITLSETTNPENHVFDPVLVAAGADVHPTIPAEPEGHLHKAVSKISKHIPHPHMHHKEGKKGKNKRQNQVSTNVPEPNPANIQHAIKEMGALSI